MLAVGHFPVSYWVILSCLLIGTNHAYFGSLHVWQFGHCCSGYPFVGELPFLFLF